MNDSALWVEKYRPQNFDEVRGQKDIIPRIQALVEQRNIPHMLFSGPPGTGKTTLALIVAKKLYGADWRQNFLELNASDSRGIDVVRNEVKNFAKTKAIDEVPFKIILLDEADALTKEAQQALRRTMETYSGSCRFILSANVSSKIIDPIKSRCALFKFKPLAREEIEALTEKIAQSEGLIVDKEAVHGIYDASEGDVRQMCNILQSCAALSKTISVQQVTQLRASIEQKGVTEALDHAIKKDFLKARGRMLDTMIGNGLSGLDIIKQIQKEMLRLEIPDDKKLQMIERCGEIEFRLVEGSDDFVQIEALLAFMCRL